MSKILRLLTVSLLLAIIMIATVAGGVFAAGNQNPDPGTCRECPNPDCPDPDGDEWKYRGER